MTIFCTVKGDKFQAAKAAADRGIPFAFDHQNDFAAYGLTVGKVDNQFKGKVLKWFAEPVSDYPSKPGTLLNWQTD